MNRFIALYLPAVDSRTIRQIVLRCYKLTPFVGVEFNKQPDFFKNSINRRLILDLKGTSLLFPDKARVAHKIQRELHKNKIQNKIGIAQTIGAAWALSRFGPESINLQTKSISKQLAGFPLQALRISSPEINSIKDTGINTLGELFSLQLKEIGFRFGINVYTKLIQLLGYVDEPLRLLKRSQRFSVKRSFSSPISSKQILSKWSGILIEDLLKQLCERSLSARAYEIWFITQDGKRTTSSLSLYLSSSSLTQIKAVLDANIESLVLDSPVKQIKIHALDLCEPCPVQKSVFEKTDQYDKESSLKGLFDLLSQKIGKDNILQAEFKQSYIPENSFSFEKYTPSKKPLMELHMQDRPSTIFTAPWPVQAIAMLPDKAPSRLQIDNQQLRIIKGFGPERVSAEWWTSEVTQANFFRDYFKVLDEHGRWLWLFRDSQSLQWFLHGIWA